MPHINVSVNSISIGSGNGLSPVRRQAITWTNAGFLSIGTLGTNLSEIWNTNIFNHENAFESIVCEMVAILFRGRWVNSLKPGEPCRCQWIGSPWIPVMACCWCLMVPNHYLKPIVIYFQLDPQTHISIRFQSHFRYFHSRKCKWKCGSHFVQASIY